MNIGGADSEWDAGANAIVLGSYGGNGELAVLNQSRVKAGAIMVGGDPANPGSDGAGVLRIGAGAVIETDRSPRRHRRRRCHRRWRLCA